MKGGRHDRTVGFADARGCDGRRHERTLFHGLCRGREDRTDHTSRTGRAGHADQAGRRTGECRPDACMRPAVESDGCGSRRRSWQARRSTRRMHLRQCGPIPSAELDAVAGCAGGRQRARVVRLHHENRPVPLRRAIQHPQRNHQRDQPYVPLPHRGIQGHRQHDVRHPERRAGHVHDQRRRAGDHHVQRPGHRKQRERAARQRPTLHRGGSQQGDRQQPRPDDPGLRQRARHHHRHVPQKRYASEAGRRHAHAEAGRHVARHVADLIRQYGHHRPADREDRGLDGLRERFRRRLQRTRQGMVFRR